MADNREALSPEQLEQVSGGNRYMILKNSTGWTVKLGGEGRQYDSLSEVVSFLKRHPADSYTCPTDAELTEVAKAYGSQLQMWRGRI